MTRKFRIGSVNFLNPVPLVWGMIHGPQREQVDLSLAIPSVCAQQIENGEIEIGLAPVAEVARQGLEILPGLGISCFGPVRSILLFSRVPWNQVRTFAADLSSRTSVQLARVILRERFGVEPQTTLEAPHLDSMLSNADAALLIGDSALRVSTEDQPFECLDLGEEWRSLTGLPMVFAAWAGKPSIPVEPLIEITRGSYEFGKAKIGEIIEQEYQKRGISRELTDAYLRHHIRYELGAKEMQGMEAFFELAGLASLAQGRGA